MSSTHYPQNHSPQKVSDLPVLNRVLISCLNLLPFRGELSSKFTRIAYGKALKHMRYTRAYLELRKRDGAWEIYWKNKYIASTQPLPQPTLTHRPLWIMATSPSLLEHKLSDLHKQDIMGLNGAIATCLDHGLTPKYYVITDTDFFNHRMPLVKKAIASGAHCFFSFNGIARICEKAPNLLRTGNVSLLERVNRYYMTPQLTEADLRKELHNHPKLILPARNDIKSGWSNDIHSGIFTGNTVTYIACQIAAFLHYQQAYILGMDLGSPNGASARSYETGENARPTTLDKDYSRYILPAFQLLADTETPTEFWNISSSSRLPESVMQRMSFQAALARHISFHEYDTPQ